MKYTTTPTIQVTVDQGHISISSLLTGDSPDKRFTWITFFKNPKQEKSLDQWDNPEYILATYKELKKKVYNEDVINVATLIGISKKDLRKQFLSAVKSAKELNML